MPGSEARIVSLGAARHNDRGEVVYSARLGDIENGLPSSQSRWAIFLKGQSGTRKVLLEGDSLPEGRTARFDAGEEPGLALNNLGQLAVIIPSQGVLLDRQGELQWLVQAGDAAPQTGSAFASFETPIVGSAFNDEAKIVVRASLSDGSRGIFLLAEQAVVRVASTGQSVPGSQGFQFSTVFSAPVLRGEWVAFLAESQHNNNQRGIFRFSSAAQLQTVVLQNQALPNGLGTAANFFGNQINASGRVAFLANLGPSGRFAVLLGAPGELTAAVQAGDDLPGFPGPGPETFGNLSLDDRGRLFFLARSGDTAGFYVHSEEGFHKIAVDGDPTPLGGTFFLGAEVELLIPIGLHRVFPTTRMNNSMQVAFHSTLSGGDLPSALFLWRSGSLTPISATAGPGAGLGERLIDELGLQSINESGTVLLRARLCCDALDSALFLSQAAPPVERFLPFLTLGEGTGSLRHSSRIDLLNHSRFNGFVEVEVFDRHGGLVTTHSRLLQGGASSSLDLSRGFDPTTGYARLTVEGGAEIGLQGQIQLSDSQGVFSQTAVPASDSATAAGLIVEVDDQADSGIALTNLADSSADLDLRLLGPDGQQAFARQLRLDPGSQTSLFLSELFEGLERPFIGYLEITSATPFLAAGLRQADLQLSTLPIDDVGQLAPSRELVNLFPALPRSENEFLQDVLTGPEGRVAILTNDQEIYLVEDEQAFAVLNGDTVLPEVGVPPLLDLGVRPLGFMQDGELVLSASFLQPTQDGLVSKDGLFQWKQGMLEKLFIQGDLLPDGSRASAQAALSPGGKLLLVGVKDTQVSFFSWQAGTLIKLHCEDALFSLERLAFDDAGRIAYVADQERLELISEGQKAVVARLGDVLGERMRVTGFGQMKLNAPDRLLFMAGGFRTPGSARLRSGLFLYDGEAVKSLLMTDDAVPGRSDATVADRDIDGLQEIFQVNASGAAVVRRSLSTADQTRLEGLFLIGNSLEKRLIFPDPGSLDNPLFSLTPSDPFDWNDSGQLLFQARSMLPFFQDALFVWQDGLTVQRLQRGNPVSAAGAPPSVIRLIHNGWRILDGRVLFQARIAGEEPSGLYLAEAGNLQQHFIPHLVQGRFDPLDYQTTLLLRNDGAESASASIRLFDSQGRNGPLLEALQLGPGQVRRVELDLQEPFTGWARVDASGSSIQVVVRISASRSGRLVSQLTIPSAERRLEGFWPDARDLIAARDGGLAVSNPYNTPLRVRIDLLDQGLAIRRQTELEIASKGHRALLYSELFPAQDCCSGFFRLRSEFPLPAVSLLLNGLRIASQPIFHSAVP